MEHLGKEIERQLEQVASEASTKPKRKESQPATKASKAEETPIEYDCPRCTDFGWVRVQVELDDPRFGKAIPCPDCNIRKIHSFDEFNPVQGAKESLAMAQEYARGQLSTPWLLLVGTYGSGKTHLAHSVLYEHRKRLQLTLFADVPRILDELRESYNTNSHSEVLRRYQAKHLVAFDDIGFAGNVTPWVQEQIYRLINQRYVEKSPTVFTTNKTMEQIADMYGGAIASRLWDSEMTTVSVLLAPDYRTGKEW